MKGRIMKGEGEWERGRQRLERREGEWGEAAACVGHGTSLSGWRGPRERPPCEGQDASARCHT